MYTSSATAYRVNPQPRVRAPAPNARVGAERGDEERGQVDDEEEGGRERVEKTADGHRDIAPEATGRRSMFAAVSASRAVDLARLPGSITGTAHAHQPGDHEGHATEHGEVSADGLLTEQGLEAQLQIEWQCVMRSTLADSAEDGCAEQQQPGERCELEEQGERGRTRKKVHEDEDLPGPAL